MLFDNHLPLSILFSFYAQFTCIPIGSLTVLFNNPAFSLFILCSIYLWSLTLLICILICWFVLCVTCTMLGLKMSPTNALDCRAMGLKILYFTFRHSVLNLLTSKPYWSLTVFICILIVQHILIAWLIDLYSVCY